MTKTSATLRRSSDRKVTNLVSPNGKVAKGANSFGLPAGRNFSCPGATSFCERICYAGKLEKVYKGVSNILINNWNALKDASVDEMIVLLDEMMDEFEAECDKNGGSRDFRIHWDGDFFSLEYARAWGWVIDNHPNVHFWVYTRSFFVLDEIYGLDNLTIYLSADPVNIDEANAKAAEYPGVLIATVADTFAEARETIVDTSRKAYPCPENGKRIPLINEKGSACIRCGICPAGRGDVLFSVKKK